jgi:ribosomal protein L24
MTRHEISQLKIGDMVVVQTGLYAGTVGKIESIDLSAAFPNGSIAVSVKGTLVKVSGVEINRHQPAQKEEDQFTADPLDESEEDLGDSHEDIGDEGEEEFENLGEMEL